MNYIRMTFCRTQEASHNAADIEPLDDRVCLRHRQWARAHVSQKSLHADVVRTLEFYNQFDELKINWTQWYWTHTGRFNIYYTYVPVHVLIYCTSCKRLIMLRWRSHVVRLALCSLEAALCLAQLGALLCIYICLRSNSANSSSWQWEPGHVIRDSTFSPTFTRGNFRISKIWLVLNFWIKLLNVTSN